VPGRTGLPIRQARLRQARPGDLARARCYTSIFSFISSTVSL
jgi:hypothetical protein